MNIDLLIDNLIYLQNILKKTKIGRTICEMTTNKIGKQICKGEESAYSIINNMIKLLEKYKIDKNLSTKDINTILNFILLSEFLIDNIEILPKSQYSEFIDILVDKILSCKERTGLLFLDKLKNLNLTSDLKLKVGEIEDFCLRSRLKNLYVKRNNSKI